MLVLQFHGGSRLSSESEFQCSRSDRRVVVGSSRGGVVSWGNVILRLFSGVVRNRCGGVTRGGVVLGGLRVVARSGVCRGVVLWRFCVVNCLSIGVLIWNGGLVVAQG
jgi:hypothetical protein